VREYEDGFNHALGVGLSPSSSTVDPIPWNLSVYNAKRPSAFASMITHLPLSQPSSGITTKSFADCRITSLKLQCPFQGTRPLNTIRLIVQKPQTNLTTTLKQPCAASRCTSRSSSSSPVEPCPKPTKPPAAKSENGATSAITRPVSISTQCKIA
jgi:hypothetical protein